MLNQLNDNSYYHKTLKVSLYSESPPNRRDNSLGIIAGVNAAVTLQRYPYLKASSASMPLVHKLRNQRFLFTVSQKCLHISSPQVVSNIEPRCSIKRINYKHRQKLNKKTEIRG